VFTFYARADRTRASFVCQGEEVSQARGGERLENKSVTAAAVADDISKACKI
jgi:hypothetical protein